VAGGWRKLHKEELHNLYTSPNIIRVIKLRKMRWDGHVARMGEIRIPYSIFVRNPIGMIMMNFTACILHRIMLG
jgi:hypothetical protein